MDITTLALAKAYTDKVVAAGGNLEKTEQLIRDLIAEMGGFGISEEIMADAVVVNGEVRLPSEGLTYEMNTEGAGYILTSAKGCTDLNIVVPRKYRGLPIVAVADNAFVDCTQMISATFYEDVKSFGENIMSGCTALRFVYVYCKEVATLGYNAFPINIEGLFVPLKSLEAYKTAMIWQLYEDKIFPLETFETVNNTIVQMVGALQQVDSALAQNMAAINENLVNNIITMQQVDQNLTNSVVGLSGAVDNLSKSDTVLQNQINKKADKSNTLKGYGIIDAYTQTEVNEKLKDEYVTTSIVETEELVTLLEDFVPEQIQTNINFNIILEKEYEVTYNGVTKRYKTRHKSNSSMAGSVSTTSNTRFIGETQTDGFSIESVFATATYPGGNTTETRSNTLYVKDPNSVISVKRIDRTYYKLDKYIESVEQRFEEINAKLQEQQQIIDILTGEGG